MRKTVLILITFLFTVLSVNVFAKDATTKTSFKVNGNCDMCKKRIEKAAKISGVKNAEWNEETHILTVAYVPAKITADQIQQSIANAGYDTEKYKALEEDYKKLPQCCQYDREK
jgi:copper chaperone CopZ